MKDNAGPDQRSVVGKAIPRIDGPQKVCGDIRYAADLKMPGMLHSKALLSEYPSAKVARINVDMARALDGAAAVLTARDVPGLGRFGILVQDQPVLVGEGEEIRFTGEALALVAAESEEIAEQALRLIKVEYEELPGIYTIDDAIHPDARRLHADKPGNICVTSEMRVGDPERAFEEADVIIEETYETPRQEHAFLEAEAGLAYVDNQGCLTIHSCTQDPYHFLCDISRALGIPMNRLRIASPPIGGGFGAKLDVTIQHWLGLLALKTGRPVKMVLNTKESVRLHAKRHPMRLRLKLGATSSGNILALSATVASDAGAYTSRTPTVQRACQTAILGPYDIPNIHVESFAVFTNNPISGAFRGYGAPQGVLAREAAIDLLAKRIGADPIELRLKNCIAEGRTGANKALVFDSPISLPTVVRELLDAAGPPPKPSNREELVGRGVAFDMPTFDLGVTPGIGMAGVGATVEMFQDGSVTIYSTAVEIGQGIATVLAQIAAEVLGQEASGISVVLGDTNTAPKAGPTSASRQTYVSGNAVLMAASKIRERLLDRAGKELEIDTRDLVMQHGHIVPTDHSRPGIELSQIASLCFNEGISLREEAWFKADHGALKGHTFMASLADVAVDAATGEVTIRKIVCSSDVGKAINPEGVHGQIYGGAIQSQGYTLMENLVCQNGVIFTPSFSEYLIPTALDAPTEMKSIIVEEPYPTGPFGAKGLGEHIMRTIPPAIMNALCNATGVNFNKPPLHPQEIFEAINSRDSSSASPASPQFGNARL